MSALGTLALALACLWVGALSVVVALLVRQVALLTHRLDPDYSLDGLAVGRRIPSAVAALLPDGSGRMLVLGAGCTPCRQLVHDLRGASVEQPVVALIEGDERLAEALAAELPAEMRSLIGEQANRAYAALDLQTTPFLFSVDRREIVHKSVPRGSQHFLSLLHQEAVPTSRPQTRILELPHVG